MALKKAFYLASSCFLRCGILWPCSQMTQEIGQCCFASVSSPSLPPLEFIQVGIQHSFMDPVHRLELFFRLSPVTFHVISTDPCYRISKKSRMIDGIMNIGWIYWNLVHIYISWPFIAPNLRPWKNVGFNFRQKCSRISSIHSNQKAFASWWTIACKKRLKIENLTNF